MEEGRGAGAGAEERGRFSVCLSGRQGWETHQAVNGGGEVTERVGGGSPWRRGGLGAAVVT